MENNTQSFPKTTKEEVELGTENDLMIMPDGTTVNVKGLTQEERAEIMRQYWESIKNN